MAPIAIADLKKPFDVPIDISLSSKAPCSPCLVTDFVRYQVKLRPQALAVHVEGEDPYTYAELWKLVERIATLALFAPDSIVPVCMDPTVEFVASLLAVMLCGAAYVVLDPNGSAERNRLIVEDCDAGVVIVHERYESIFDRALSIESILSDNSIRQDSHNEVPSGSVASPSDLAYLVYTSGSTGTPKGVLLSHRAASHGISEFDLNGHKRWLLFYNPVFSAAQRTILATLAKGACLCLARRDRLATALPELLETLQIDALGITPSALSLLFPSEIPNCLKQITTVGEPLSPSLVDTWADKVHLRVSYGLSECAQLNFSRQLQRGSDPKNPGRPIDTTTAVIWEPGTTRQLPVGEAGELCLSGPQIANGYRNRPRETNAAFVKDELSSNIVFRTGDLAVRLSDDTFQILGRTDHQIKIHSQRVEPGEVAERLRNQAGVAEIVCLGATINDKVSLLVAVIPNPETSWVDLVKDLRYQAQRVFPPYMVPSYWLQYQKFPLNHNGKIDFKSIRVVAESSDIESLLGRGETFEGKGYIFSEIASEIVEIWADILQLRPSSILPTDSFVALGGTSIEAIKTIRELRARGIHIEMADLLQAQSVEDIADLSMANMQGTAPDQLDLPEPFSLLPDQSLQAELLADRGVVDAFPLTALQEGILASSLQGNQDYLYQRIFDVRHLDIVRLQLAFQVIFWRSDTLRSTFVTSSKGFAQVVRHDFPLPWKNESMSLVKYLKADKSKGVTLGDPFMRVALLNGDTLVVTVHHTLFDFWSHVFMFEDVARLYYGQLPKPRASWRSFIGLLHNQDMKLASDEFWRRHLADATPTILNSSPVQETSSVTKTLSVDLKSAASSLHIPKSSILYAAWALILSSHTASKSVTMAIAVSGRELPMLGIETLDGPTLAVVPQAVVVNPENSLLELVQGVNADLWEITKHSQHGIRGALVAAGHQGNSSLFDTMVNILVQEQDSDEITREVFQKMGKQSPWKTEFTTLNIQEGVEGMEIILTGAMEQRRLEFILDQFCCAVETIISTPRLAIKSVSLISSKELDLLLRWNEDQQPNSITLHGQFELIAKLHAPNVALNYENEKFLTYAELDQMANRMSNYLFERDVFPGDVVPLLLEKSPFMIATILALLKIGAAYVPLSPENPVERNAFIVRDVGAKLVLTETEHASFFDSETETVPILLVDTARLCAYSTEKPDVDVSPTALAYIIYTSGSTGQPKGVMINHNGCTSAMRSIIEFENRQSKPFRHLQFSNYIFDASVYDIFATLHSGGTLCLASSNRLLSDLAGVINEMNVNHVFMTPTVARLLDPKTVPTLESMVVGGEPLTPDVVAVWASKITLINAYGPTEASVMVTMKNVNTEMGTGNIGTAFPSVGAVILEQNGLRPVPYGSVGELCFRGPQLSSGYFKRPDVTNAAFIESEICSGERLYRSGDLGRYIPGGDIECLGRKDNQVKINGHRIELGEIEQAILRTGEVQECILTVWKKENLAHLVATVIFNGVKDNSIKEDGGFLSMDMFTEQLEKLKASLSGLAFYMFPKFVLPLPSFPLLPSGKANRKELKAQVQSLSQADLTPYSFNNVGGLQGAEIIPVVSEEQKSLQEAWIEILQLPSPQFGQEASFLSLGGDSISAINLVSWLRRKGLGITVRDVLRYPLLGSMAEHLQRDTNDEPAATSPKLVFSPPAELDRIVTSTGLGGDNHEYIYPCPPGQAEFLSQGARPESFWCLMAVRSLGYSSNVTQWIDLATKLTETNDILRTTFVKHEGKWYGVVLPDPTPAVEFYDVNSAEERMQILDSIWSEKFAFGKPFIRYVILRLPDGEHQVVSKLDHGLYDGTLLRVFDAHFQKYQRSEPLEEFTSFKEFAFHVWTINQMRQTLTFWQQPNKQPIQFQLKPDQNSHQQDRPRPSIDSFAVHIIEQDQLESFSRSSGVTVSILFQAIFQIWLALRSSQRDVAFDYLYTGRNVDLPDPQNINGTCANFLPMRSRVDMQARIQDFLLQTQDDFWQYTENSTVGIDEIYRSCGEGISRETSANQALFLFQPFEPAAPSSFSAGEAGEPQRWLVMAKSETTMPEPYAVVFEVIRTAHADKYKVKFAYDSSIWTKEEVEKEFSVVEQIVSRVVEDPDRLVGNILRDL
ncbi:Nonribosomal peptide synthetases (NRPS) [Penicillium verhagenii]|nr:Nonribosomal peptide synthetases (NRPS) [Penicillium verhagenii]